MNRASRLTSRKRRERKGVLLLVVVACILIAGLAMVGITRQSLRMATSALKTESELQQRWGVISLQRTLMTGAPEIFTNSDNASLIAGKTGPFPSTVRSEVLLGGIKFNLLLADEQAKLNLNLAYHMRGKNTAQQLAEKMKGIGGLRTRLMPEVQSADIGRQKSSASDDDEEEDAAENETSLPVAFRHWGQVFDLSNSPSAAPGQLVPAATSRLTCWGRGAVNITRASNEIIEETCRTALGPGVARKLVSQYRENPTQNIRQVAVQLKVDDQGVNALRQLVTTESATYSLWLESTALSGTQRWFSVASPRDEAITTERFPF